MCSRDDAELAEEARSREAGFTSKNRTDIVRERERRKEEGKTERHDRSAMLIGFRAPVIPNLFRGCREFREVYANTPHTDNADDDCPGVFSLCTPSSYRTIERGTAKTRSRRRRTKPQETPRPGTSETELEGKQEQGRNKAKR